MEVDWSGCGNRGGSPFGNLGSLRVTISYTIELQDTVQRLGREGHMSKFVDNRVPAVPTYLL